MDFYRKYKDHFHLPKPSPSKGACKPLRSQEQEIEIEQEKEQEIDSGGAASIATPKKRSRFTPPSLEEVAAYCRERNNQVDPRRWIDHYTSNGWRVGKNPMCDWKATVRTWERNGFSNGASPKSELFAGPSAFAAEETQP